MILCLRSSFFCFVKMYLNEDWPNYFCKTLFYGITYKIAHLGRIGEPRKREKKRERDKQNLVRVEGSHLDKILTSFFPKLTKTLQSSICFILQPEKKHSTNLWEKNKQIFEKKKQTNHICSSSDIMILF